MKFLRNGNHVKQIEEYMICAEKHVLTKNVYKWAKRWRTTRRLRRKTVDGVETQGLSGKENVSDAVASKIKFMLTEF